ncbi:hypothetical protein [Mycobacterium leprae]
MVSPPVANTSPGDCLKFAFAERYFGRFVVFLVTQVTYQIIAWGTLQLR